MKLNLPIEDEDIPLQIIRRKLYIKNKIIEANTKLYMYKELKTNSKTNSKTNKKQVRFAE